MKRRIVWVCVGLVTVGICFHCVNTARKINSARTAMFSADRLNISGNVPDSTGHLVRLEGSITDTELIHKLTKLIFDSRTASCYLQFASLDGNISSSIVINLSGVSKDGLTNLTVRICGPNNVGVNGKYGWVARNDCDFYGGIEALMSPGHSNIFKSIDSPMRR